MVIVIFGQLLDVNQKVDELKAIREKHVTIPIMEPATNLVAPELIQKTYSAQDPTQMKIAKDELVLQGQKILPQIAINSLNGGRWRHRQVILHLLSHNSFITEYIPESLQKPLGFLDRMVLKE